MKKITTLLISLILAFTMSVSIFSGCALINKNNERDMAQVVATVKIDDAAPLDKIYKREVIIMYLNYGYQYVQNYGYTLEQAIKLIVDSLVTNRIITQTACEYMYAKLTSEEQAKITDKYDASAYLTEDEKAEALYNTIKSFNDIIDGYIEEDEEETKEDYSETVRTTPTDAKVAKDKKELGRADWDKYNAKGIITGYGETRDDERVAAYNKTLDALKVNSLLGEDFDYQKDDITKTDYYKTNIKNNQESLLNTNYTEALRLDALKMVTYEQLAERYTEMYNAQVKSYGASEADYKTALGAINNDTTKVVYNPYSGYGYVYNILLGADSVQSAALTELKADKDKLGTAEYRAKRAEILASTTVKDLRSTWVTNNYDYNMETGKFGEDYGNYPFQGNVSWLNETDKPAAGSEDEDDYSPEYKVTALKEFSLSEFMTAFDAYVYGDESFTANDNKDYYKSKEYALTDKTKIADFRSKINDMLFAFSTDPGSLNTVKGYVSAPVPAPGESETYVQEFANAARDMLTKGVGSYAVVATDFGYHIIVCSEKITANTNYETLTEYLTECDGYENEAAAKAAFTRFATLSEDELTDEEKDTFLYKYFAAFVKSYITDNQTRVQNELIKKYKEDTKKVNVYEKTYADLK